MAQGQEDDRAPVEEKDEAGKAKPANRRQGTVSEDPQDFVLSRELTEIYLLLDNISANPDTTISALAARQDLPEGLDKNWIDQVTGITWPPPNSEKQRAEKASLLLRVKDYLNRLAKPASGLTIAFTHLVTQEDDFEPPNASSAEPLYLNDTMSRGGLAYIAYPDLYATATRFRRVQLAINWVLLAWLVVTCFLSWWVAYGNDALREYAGATKQLELAQQRVDDGEAGRVRTVDSDKGDKAGQSTGLKAVSTPASVLAASAPVEEVGYCERWRLRVPKENEPVPYLPRWENAEQRQACLALAESEAKVKQAEGVLWEWLGPIGRGFLGVTTARGDAASTAGRLTAVLGGAVLPILYGFLGAGAAILRSVSRKIKSSTLSPRDLSLLLQQLALGAVVGACIGLFIAQPDEGSSLIGPVTLSASAISFVAGFGVDSVFQALEALISRIFNIAPAGGQPDGK